VLWSQGGAATSTVDTVASPLGGLALDTTTKAAWSVAKVGLGMNETVTVAYWLKPGVSGSASMSGLRGVTDALRHMLYASNDGQGVVNFTPDGSEAGILWEDDQADWYLVTVTVDNSLAAEWVVRMTMQRLRDGAAQTRTWAVDPTGGAYQTLDEGFDDWWSGMSMLFGIGGIIYWNGFGAGYFDRIGVWNRALSLEEIDTLYGAGLGWLPET
jgi:hypothetical protein